MNKKEALIHAIITWIVIVLICAAIAGGLIGIIWLLVTVATNFGIAATGILIILILSFIVSVRSYFWYRKYSDEDE